MAINEFFLGYFMFVPINFVVFFISFDFSFSNFSFVYCRRNRTQSGHIKASSGYNPLSLYMLFNTIQHTPHIIFQVSLTLPKTKQKNNWAVNFSITPSCIYLLTWHIFSSDKISSDKYKQKFLYHFSGCESVLQCSTDLLMRILFRTIFLKLSFNNWYQRQNYNSLPNMFFKNLPTQKDRN